MQLSKTSVVAAIRDVLRVELAAMERMAADARDEVGSAETKQEGKYDTRSTEASYLARGQAHRIIALRRLAAWFERFDATVLLDPPVVQTGALLRLEGDDTRWVFVAPDGGVGVELGGVSVRVVSPRSPLGEAMAECEVDDEFEVDSPRGIRSWTVTSLA